MAKYNLPEEIIALSESDNWDEAKEEWQPRNVYWDDEGDTCLCGHAIKEICEIVNIKNGNRAEVGNCCVNKFMAFSVDRVFAGIRRVIKDPSATLNSAAIKFLHENDVINSWERKFYLDNWRKRIFTDAQQKKILQINAKVLKRITRGN